MSLSIYISKKNNHNSHPFIFIDGCMKHSPHQNYKGDRKFDKAM